MATEPPLPYDLHDANDLGRFTHVVPSTLTDSEHEVIVEADSDSDIPSLKARKDRSSSRLPVNGRKKGPVIKKKLPPIEPQPTPLIPEDLLYHLMDQNKVLMDQNKALTQRLEPSDPFPIVFPREEIPVVHERPIMPDYPPSPPHFQPCPEQFLPDYAPPPVKRKPKEATEDKLYAQCKELWDVLPRVLRVLEAAAPAPTADSPAVKSKPWVDDFYDPFNDMILAQYSPPYEPGASHEEKMFAISKDNFFKGLADAERRFGINQKPKKYGKKAKPKTDNSAKFKTFDRDDLMPYAWKALALLQNFFVVFVMIQLSLLGGDMFQFFKKSPKNSSWLGF